MLISKKAFYQVLAELLQAETGLDIRQELEKGLKKSLGPIHTDEEGEPSPGLVEIEFVEGGIFFKTQCVYQDLKKKIPSLPTEETLSSVHHVNVSGEDMGFFFVDRNLLTKIPLSAREKFKDLGKKGVSGFGFETKKLSNAEASFLIRETALEIDKEIHLL